MTKRNILIFSLVVLLCIFALVYIPYWQVHEKGIKGSRERIELENRLRVTLAQTLGATILLIGLYFAWRRITAVEKSVEVSRQEQITERFTRAINQLGASHGNGEKKLEIRLGGIYALERIARESEENHWPVVEVLTAYVRENARWRDNPSQPEEGIGSENEKIRQLALSAAIPKIPADIQAVLTVLGRRALTYQDGEEHRIDLNHTNLQGALLRGARLQGALLFRANLQRATLYKSNLLDAFLDGSDLQEANLNYANLQRASLKRTSLQGAYLMGAKLLNCRLIESLLYGADLRGADLRGANLEGANLSGANLQNAKLREAKLGKVNLKGANLEGADLEETDLRIADLREANLEGTNFSGARLSGANLGGANLRGSNLGGADLEGANLRIADLGRANLERVNLGGANLQKAYLERANLKKAKGLPVEQLSKVETLYEVKLGSQLKKQIKKDYPHLLERP